MSHDLTMTKISSLALAVLMACSLAAQEGAPPEQQALERGAAAEASWQEATGSGPTLRTALAQALRGAVSRARGAAFVLEPSVRSRLEIVARHERGGDGDSSIDRAWTLGQLPGLVLDFEVLDQRPRGESGYDVRLRALVSSRAVAAASIVVELVDNDLTSWVLERFEESGPGRAFDQRRGRFEGPRIGSYLRRSGAVRIASPAGDDPVAAATRLVPSHRVVIDWQPLVVRSTVEKPNRARPTSGPRPEFMSGGAVDVAVRVEDVVQGVTLLDEKISVPAVRPDTFSIDRLDAFVTDLVDVAKAQVARRIFFTLRPPVVLRKWVGDGGAWHVEARISKRIASGFQEFVLGQDGSLASPDWRRLAAADFVGGSAVSSTFRLGGLLDASQVEVGVCEVRPIR